MELSYSTAGQPGPTAVYAPPYATTAPPSAALGPGGPPPPPPPSGAVSAGSVPMSGMLPYGVEIPNRVFVGGCPFSMTDKQLGEVFAKYGNVKDSKIIADRSTGKSKGYGFVTFSTEEEAVNVHAMGSIFYNEKKLNLARAIRKCGGQFNRANQEYMNGQRAVWMHPSGYLIQQFEGNWHFEQFNSHSQPVKPCYPMYYPPPPAVQHHQPYYSGGYSPVGGTTFFPQNQPSAYTAHVSNPPPPPNNADNNASTAEDSIDEQGEEKERETPSSTSPPSSPSEKKDSDQLAEQVKQLSLDSAYTSEADLEQSTSSSVSPKESPGTPQELGPASDHEGAEDSGHDDGGGGRKEAEPPVDISRIVERRSPHIAIRSSHVPARVPPKYTNIFSASPPGHQYSSSHGPVYYGPASGYVPTANPYTYNPYTPQAAIQTIGPMYHTNQ